MLHDARQIPHGSTLEGDVVVVGAGPAGISIANELAGTQLRVILLEAGGLEFDRETQSLYEGENIGLPYPPLHTARSRFFGGSSNCWGGLCRPLDPIDFEQRDWVPNSGWPFGRTELEPYYLRAQSFLGLGPYDYSPEFWQDRLGDPKMRCLPVESRRLSSRIAQRNQQWRIGSYYADKLKTAEDVAVYLHANLVGIELNDVANTVTGMRARTLSGGEFRVTGKHYILALGGIETPRMLLLSTDVTTSGIANGYDLVGRYFMEHPRVITGELALSNPSSALAGYDLTYTLFNSPAAFHLALRDDVLRSERLVNYKAWILAVYKGQVSRGGLALQNLYRAAKRSTLPDYFLETPPSFWLRNVAAALIDLPNSVSAALGHLTMAPWLLDTYTFSHVCEPTPNPDSRVTLGHQKDRFGLNRVRLDWQLSRLDKRTIGRAQAIIGEELATAGFAKVGGRSLDDDDDNWPDDLLCCWHHMGTTRMHEDPRRGVVDPDCRVHGMSNLWIAGSSVFPSAGTDFPTMTIVALALRLADRLRAVMGAIAIGLAFTQFFVLGI